MQKHHGKPHNPTWRMKMKTTTVRCKCWKWKTFKQRWQRLAVDVVFFMAKELVKVVLKQKVDRCFSLFVVM